jgi:hypothetical protein
LILQSKAGKHVKATRIKISFVMDDPWKFGHFCHFGRTKLYEPVLESVAGFGQNFSVVKDENGKVQQCTCDEILWQIFVINFCNEFFFEKFIGGLFNFC